MTSGRRIAIAGAGIGGLTAALAFAERDFHVTLIERAERLAEIGAGLQLSPNATRILARYGVLDKLLDVSVRPQSVTLRNAASLGVLTEIPLGAAAEMRWRAPYLVLHRAALQAVLFAAVKARKNIETRLGATLRHVDWRGEELIAGVESATMVDDIPCDLLVGADGVWSTARTFVAQSARSRPTSKVAWRTMLKSGDDVAAPARGIFSPDAVTAFVHPKVHLIAYPVSKAGDINLVGVMKGTAPAGSWSSSQDIGGLKAAMGGWAPSLAVLPDRAGPWTAWPLHTVDPGACWTDRRGIALIGDAAHAMTPFAAQGAAMAIEDAEALAVLVAHLPERLPAALTLYERMRRDRIKRVVRRGAFNHFAWHASGPVALIRNMVLKSARPDRFADDLAWLYGHDAAEAAAKALSAAKTGRN